MKRIAAAILRRNDKILICRRGPGGSCGYLWEFPGGKIEPGETGEDCAVRECREELGVEIQLQGLREETVYEYPDGPYGFAFYDGVIISGEPEKKVHLEIRWVSPEELTDFSFCPADRPMVERLSRAKRKTPLLQTLADFSGQGSAARLDLFIRQAAACRVQWPGSGAV